MKKLTLLIAIAFLLFSCSAKEEEESTPELAYTKAMKLLEDKNYQEASKQFVAIDEEFPFSRWAKKGQVMAIYAYYKNEDYDKLTALSDDFIRLNSSSEYIPYILYMKGLAAYEQIPPISRAQDQTQQASFTFRELIARFPDTQYADDATEKLKFIDEHLAGYNMSIGRYQIETKNFVGAIDSFNQVISRYRRSKQVPEAYFRLNEIYQRIGLNSEAKIAAEKLQEKFPENYWTKLALKNGQK